MVEAQLASTTHQLASNYATQPPFALFVGKVSFSDQRLSRNA
jgi:hypothetical protein